VVHEPQAQTPAERWPVVLLTADSQIDTRALLNGDGGQWFLQWTRNCLPMLTKGVGVGRGTYPYPYPFWAFGLRRRRPTPGAADARKGRFSNRRTAAGSRVGNYVDSCTRGDLR
jgi:hypothetical protein